MHPRSLNFIAAFCAPYLCISQQYNDSIARFSVNSNIRSENTSVRRKKLCPSVRQRKTEARVLGFSLSIKSFFRLYNVSRGRAHEIDFAKQNHKNREHVSRFLYFEREKVSAWELSDVRVLRSQNTDCRKNEVFRQAQTEARVLGLTLHLILFVISFSRRNVDFATVFTSYRVIYSILPWCSSA